MISKLYLISIFCYQKILKRHLLFDCMSTEIVSTAFLFPVTNPIDVIKIRMQLENELAKQKGLEAIRNRYYDGFVRGGAQIVRDEGVPGLYKG